MSGSMIVAWLVVVWAIGDVRSGSTLLPCWSSPAWRPLMRFGCWPSGSRSPRVRRAGMWTKPSAAGGWRCRRQAWCSPSSCRPRWPLGCVSTLVRPGSRSPPWWPGRCRSSCNGDVDSVDAGERPAGRDRVRLRPPRGHGLVGGLRHSCARAAGPHRAVRPGSEWLP